MTILVFGGSGTLRRAVSRRLIRSAGVEQGVQIVADRPSGSAASHRRDPSLLEVDRDSLTEVASTIARGSEILLLAGNEAERAHQDITVLAAAEMQGVRRITLVTSLRSAESHRPSAARHLALEAALRRSTLARAVVRVGLRTDHLARLVYGARRTGSLPVLHETGAPGRMAPATAEHYAQAITRIVHDDTYLDRTLDLTGSRSIEREHLLQALQDAASRPVHPVPLSEESLRFRIESILPGARAVDEHLAFHHDVARGVYRSHGDDLAQVLANPTLEPSDLLSAVPAIGRSSDDLLSV